MSTTAPLGQVNKQLQAEVSHFLVDDCNNLPVMTRVHNFDFAHVIRYINKPSKTGRLNDYAVQENGAASRRLLVELGGPYNDQWRKNLSRWIDYLDAVMPGPKAEFGALHTAARVRSRYAITLPTKLVLGVLTMHEDWPIGAGRWELEKIRAALCGRWRMEGGQRWLAHCDETMEKEVSRRVR